MIQISRAHYHKSGKSDGKTMGNEMEAEFRLWGFRLSELWDLDIRFVGFHV